MTTFQGGMLFSAIIYIFFLLDNLKNKLEHINKMIVYLHKKVDKLNNEDEEDETL